MKGDTRQQLLVLVGVLVVALVVVVYLWQQEKQSTEVEFDVDVPEETSMRTAPESVPPVAFASVDERR